jgi:hypothetical protein
MNASLRVLQQLIGDEDSLIRTQIEVGGPPRFEFTIRCAQTRQRSIAPVTVRTPGGPPEFNLPPIHPPSTTIPSPTPHAIAAAKRTVPRNYAPPSPTISNSLIAFRVVDSPGRSL